MFSPTWKEQEERIWREEKLSQESDWLIWTKLGTLIVFLMASRFPLWAASFSFTATFCRSLQEAEGAGAGEGAGGRRSRSR